MIVLRTLAMNAAITEPDVGLPSTAPLVGLAQTVHVIPVHLHSHLTVCFQKNCGALTHLVKPSLSTKADVK